VITVQDVFHRFYDEYAQKHTPTFWQSNISQKIMNCRTAAMGGRTLECDHCGHTVIVYNSCRNRHCPLCQGITRAIWVDKKSADVVNAPYFHLVLTMPEELRGIIHQNDSLLYSLMYRASADAIKELAQDENYLGAQVGFFSLLHTWSQDLHYHPHIHVVLMAGGLNKQNEWVASSKNFFIPVGVLSSMFRGKYLSSLSKLYQQGELKFYGQMEKYKDPALFQKLIDQCYNIRWYSYIQETFSGPQAVINYLGRYTHQIAIANSRLISMDDHNVTFTVRGKDKGDQTETVTLSGTEFIRRFLMHVLPKGFVKIRNYGLLANVNKKTKLAMCRALTNSPLLKPQFENMDKFEVACVIAGYDLSLCPSCKVGVLVLKNISGPPGRAGP